MSSYFRSFEKDLIPGIVPFNNIFFFSTSAVHLPTVRSYYRLVIGSYRKPYKSVHARRGGGRAAENRTTGYRVTCLERNAVAPGCGGGFRLCRRPGPGVGDDKSSPSQHASNAHTIRAHGRRARYHGNFCRPPDDRRRSHSSDHRRF